MNFYLFADSLLSSIFSHIRMVEGWENFVVKEGVVPQGRPPVSYTHLTLPTT